MVPQGMMAPQQEQGMMVPQRAGEPNEPGEEEADAGEKQAFLASSSLVETPHCALAHHMGSRSQPSTTSNSCIMRTTTKNSQRQRSMAPLCGKSMEILARTRNFPTVRHGSLCHPTANTCTCVTDTDLTTFTLSRAMASGVAKPMVAKVTARSTASSAPIMAAHTIRDLVTRTRLW